MKIHEKTIDWYTDRMCSDSYFSVAGYSDAEWFCLIGINEGETTALGQVISSQHGKLLLNVLIQRQEDKRFLFAVPKCLWSLPQFNEGQIESFLLDKRVEIEAYERDMVTDDLARQANLFPFIHQLQKMDVVIIGNAHLREIDFIDYRYFIEIHPTNLHMFERGISDAVKNTLDYGKPAVYLVSAGLSSAVIIHELHNRIPNSWFIDCGSMWDAFVGIGGQRTWRERLFKNPQKLEQWKRRNIYGT